MSAPDGITVLARWHVNAGSVDEVLKLVAELKPQTLGEPGCLGYDVFRSIDSSTELLLVERNKDDAAIDEHRGSAHYQALVVARILPLLTDRRVELLRAHGS